MHQRLVIAALLGTLAAGCELAPPKDLVGYLNLHLNYHEHGVQYQITESGIVSPNTQLSREEGVLRGWTFGQPIEMRVEGNVIKGSRGPVPIELHVSREGNAVVARGMYGGHLADLAMCAPSADRTAAEGEVKSFAGDRPCILENTATVVKMFRVLGDSEAMAMLVAAYYH
ncbi:MAG: hypothetical protein ABJE95_03360 [Byssovorax sp.]